MSVIREDVSVPERTDCLFSVQSRRNIERVVANAISLTNLQRVVANCTNLFGSGEMHNGTRTSESKAHRTMRGFASRYARIPGRDRRDIPCQFNVRSRPWQETHCGVVEGIGRTTKREPIKADWERPIYRLNDICPLVDHHIRFFPATVKGQWRRAAYGWRACKLCRCALYGSTGRGKSRIVPGYRPIEFRALFTPVNFRT